MTKEAGLGASLTVDDVSTSGQDISNDVGDVSYDVSRVDLQVTGIDLSAMERLLGIADLQVSLSGFFNDAADLSCVVFKSAGSTAVVRTIAFALSGQTFTAECHILGVQWSRGRDGGMTFTASLGLQDGTDPAWS